MTVIAPINRNKPNDVTTFSCHHGSVDPGMITVNGLTSKLDIPCNAVHWCFSKLHALSAISASNNAMTPQSHHKPISVWIYDFTLMIVNPSNGISNGCFVRASYAISLCKC